MDDHILYPEFKKDRVAHHPLAWNYLPPKKERSPVTINKLKPYLQNPNMNVLLSSEDFSAIQDPSKIKKDLDSLGVFNVKIIVYLRRQDEWLESAYNQKTKTGSLETLCSDYDKKRDWSLLLKRWEESFGQQNLIVKVYDRAQMPQGIIADFLDIFSLTPEKFTIPADSNKSIDSDLLQIKRLANEIEVQVPLNKIDHINDILLQNYPQKKFLFSFDERLKILKNYQKSNESVAQKYFGRKNLFSESEICKNNYVQYKGLDIEKVCVISLLFLKAHHIDTQKEHRNYHKLKKKMKRYFLRVTVLILIQGAIIFYLLLMQSR